MRLPSIGLFTTLCILGIMASGKNFAAETRAVPFFGQWRGGAYSNDQTHQFSHCAAAASYRSGILMVVGVDRQFGWRLLFTDQDWNLVGGTTIPVIITFDGVSPWTGTATVVDAHAAKIEMVDNKALIQSFRMARTMTVNASGQTFGFALDGTSRLLINLVQCVKNSLAIERGELPPNFTETEPTPIIQPVNPPPMVVPQPSRTAELETEMAATRIATNLLLESKLPNARLLSASETPTDLQGRGAVWTSDVGMGAVELLAAAAGRDPQQVASSMLSGDASKCRGDFASSRSSELVDGKIVTKANSLCTDSGGLRSIRYFILQADPAGYVVYALAGSNAGNGAKSGAGAATPPPMQDADFQAAAVKAAFVPK